MPQHLVRNADYLPACLPACLPALGNLPRLPAEQKMMLKERASGMYRLSAFYLARTASDIPSDMTIPSLFIVVACEPP